MTLNPFVFGADEDGYDFRPGVQREDRLYAPMPGSMPARLDAHLQRATEAAIAKDRKAVDDPEAVYLPAEKVIELIEVVSFANQYYGIALNGFLTVNWSWCGVVDPGAVSRLTTLMMNRIGKARASAFPDTPLLYVLVHENALGRLHSHVLINLPNGARPALLAQVERSVAQLTGIAPPPHTVDVQQRQDQRMLASQWRYVRYVAKSLDPDSRIRAADGRIYPLGALLQLEKWQASGPIGDKSRLGGAIALSTTARTRSGHISALRLGAFAQLYDGWEERLCQHRRDRARAEDQAAAFAMPTFLSPTLA